MIENPASRFPALKKMVVERDRSIKVLDVFKEVLTEGGEVIRGLGQMDDPGRILPLVLKMLEGNVVEK